VNGDGTTGPVWLPQGARREAMGALPASLDLRPWGEEPGTAAFVVLPPPAREEFAGLLARMTALRVVQTLNAGIDWVPALPDGVLLCNGSGVHDGPVAEWVVAVILAMEKRLPHFVDQQRAGHWDETANLAFADGIPANDIAGSRVLVVGHGSIGRAVAARLEPFGTEVVGLARRERADTRPLTDLPALLPTADVVVLLAPATDETRGMVDAAFLARMRHGALLVNGARGSLIDQDALLSAAREGRIRAALDATDPEPLPHGHPLWSTPGVLVTPHVAGSSAHWQDRAYALVGDQLRRWAAGEPLLNVRDAGY
jgi:phosphoglycerate dehydrogenase-like enzyme